MKYVFTGIALLTAGFLLAFAIRMRGTERLNFVPGPASAPERESSPQAAPSVSPRAESLQESELLAPWPEKKLYASTASGTASRDAGIPALPVVILPPPLSKMIIPTSTPRAAPSPPEISAAVPSSSPAFSPPLPPLDEERIMRAIVKIECPSKDGRGRYIGSGFVRPRGVVVTAAHLVKDSGSDECRVVFPHKRVPSHYLAGKIEDREAADKRLDEEGIDIAFIVLPALADYPEARAIFSDEYPSVPYPLCTDPAILGNATLHFGYPANFQDQSYLARSQGEAAAYADIRGIREVLSQNQTIAYKSPELTSTADQSRFHPYGVSRVPSFYGDSGGLAFDATRQCILGPTRGGSIGGGAGENLSIYGILSWPGAPSVVLP